MFGLSIQELMIVGVVAVLLFGKRLPDVARKLGKSYAEFREGLHGMQSEMNSVTRSIDQEVDKASRQLTYDESDYEEPTAPKFEPPA